MSGNGARPACAYCGTPTARLCGSCRRAVCKACRRWHLLDPGACELALSVAEWLGVR